MRADVRQYLTEEIRKVGIEKSARVRRAQTKAKADLKAGLIDVADIIGNPDCGSMRVFDMFSHLPGYTKDKARQCMKVYNVAENKKVKGLGIHQKEKLSFAFRGLKFTIKPQPLIPVKEPEKPIHPIQEPDHAIPVKFPNSDEIYQKNQALAKAANDAKLPNCGGPIPERREVMAKVYKEYYGEPLPESGLKDTGKRTVSKTGGLREPKPERFDLMSIAALYMEARHYGNGAKKYAPRNWEKGVDYTTCTNAIMRHTLKYILFGNEDEDHLSAIRWNAAALRHYEITRPELNDLAWGEDGMPKEDRELLKAWLKKLEESAE